MANTEAQDWQGHSVQFFVPEGVWYSMCQQGKELGLSEKTLGGWQSPDVEDFGEQALKKLWKMVY